MAKKSTFKPRNPFIYEGYEGPEYFCDRAGETEELITNLQNGRNTTLLSPRKIGKTGTRVGDGQKVKAWNPKVNISPSYIQDWQD